MPLSGSKATINTSYLSKQSVGTTSLTFNFSGGSTATLTVTMENTTPQNSTISPTIATVGSYQ